MSEYDDPYTCKKCGEPNRFKTTDTVNGYLSEASTVCSSCGHKDYWAQGYFQSKSDTVAPRGESPFKCATFSASDLVTAPFDTSNGWTRDISFEESFWMNVKHLEECPDEEFVLGDETYTNAQIARGLRQLADTVGLEELERRHKERTR